MEVSYTIYHLFSQEYQGADIIFSLMSVGGQAHRIWWEFMKTVRDKIGS